MTMKHDSLIPRILELHKSIRTRVRDALSVGARSVGEDPALEEAAVTGEGAADVNYAIDVPADEEVDRFAEELAREVPVVQVSEGTGIRRLGNDGQGDGAIRLIADPIDGTRNLAYDMRSGWVLTALANEKGDATALSDVQVAVQSEIPTRGSNSYHVMTAVRGGGARLERRSLEGDELLEQRVLGPSSDDRLDNGYYVFFKFSPEDRVAISEIEENFLRTLVSDHGVDRRTLCDDQYISNAGQLFLMLTRRYRFLCDLRGLVGDVLGVDNFTSKPYDVCCSLIAEEAKVPLTLPDGGAFDVPLDLDHRVSFVAYANDALRQKLQPILNTALADFRKRHL